jgi:hypothetical protein
VSSPNAIGRSTRLVSFLAVAVKSTESNVSPIVHLLVQRVKPVLNEELVRQIQTTYQFDIGTLGQFYLDLKHGSSTEKTLNRDARSLS